MDCKQYKKTEYIKCMRVLHKVSTYRKQVAELVIHVVKPGDSVFSIAQRYAVPYAQIVSENQLQTPDSLVIGQTLVIPTDVTRHTVASGESLYSIAQRYGVSLDAVINANPQLTNPSRIHPGDRINIPTGLNKLGSMEVNGFVFPSINIDRLRSLLPYLTYISIFSYQVRPDGSLSTINDAAAIETARAGGVAPMMVITNIEEGASFSSALAHTILTDTGVQDTLITNILDTLRAKNYYGLNIDFEYVYPEDRENYNNFLRKITQALHDAGYIVSTAIAPKLSAGQTGLLYEAHDYPIHGEVVDQVIIMTYEWGYLYARSCSMSSLLLWIKRLHHSPPAIL